jgi:hypothetical protein
LVDVLVPIKDRRATYRLHRYNITSLLS